MAKPIDYAEAERVIERIAELAEAFAEQAGVGGVEVAGLILSYLVEHPRDTAPVLRFGVFEMPADWIRQGRLSYMTKDGRVVSPCHARRAAIIAKMRPGS